MAVTTKRGSGGEENPPAEGAKPKRTASSRPQPQGVSLWQFLGETFDELRKVVWPTPQELVRYTIVVIFTVVVIGLLIAGIDSLLHTVEGRFIFNGIGGQ